MTTREHAELENVEAYLLGALSDKEMAQMAVHVRECLVCRSEIRSYDRTMDLLPLSVPLRRAPDTLRRRILRQVKRRRFPWKPVAGAVAAAAVAAGVVAGMDTYSWSRDLEQKVNSLSEENANLTAEVAEIKPQAQQVQSLRERANGSDARAYELQNDLERQQDLFLLVSSPGVQSFRASGTTMAPLATGTILLDGTNNMVYLVLKNLPRLENSMYQLWISDGDAQLVPLRRFNSSENGSVDVQHPIEGAIRTLMVTIEPLDDTDELPGTFVLISNVSNTSLAAQDLSIPSSPN